MKWWGPGWVSSQVLAILLGHQILLLFWLMLMADGDKWVRFWSLLAAWTFTQGQWLRSLPDSWLPFLGVPQWDWPPEHRRHWSPLLLLCFLRWSCPVISPLYITTLFLLPPNFYHHHHPCVSENKNFSLLLFEEEEKNQKTILYSNLLWALRVLVFLFLKNNKHL